MPPGPMRTRPCGLGPLVSVDSCSRMNFAAGGGISPTLGANLARLFAFIVFHFNCTPILGHDLHPDTPLIYQRLDPTQDTQYGSAPLASQQQGKDHCYV